MTNDHRNIEENHAWDRMSKWDTFVEKRIQQLIGDGDMSWHPKAGQPFEFLDEDEDAHVPDNMKMAYKIMKDNDAVPPWMSLGFTLRDKYTKIMKRVKHYARDYVARREKAVKMGSFILHREADERWQKATRQLRIDIGMYNAELLNYNLQIPNSIEQMIPIDTDDLIESALAEADK